MVFECTGWRTVEVRREEAGLSEVVPKALPIEVDIVVAIVELPVEIGLVGTYGT
jgi:hypothetical protein